MQQHLAANKIKDKLEQKGFNYTVSLYGIIRNPETTKHEYRRVEVFINGVPDEVDVVAIKNFFEDLIPYNYYSIWVYNRELKEIFLYKGFD